MRMRVKTAVTLAVATAVIVGVGTWQAVRIHGDPDSLTVNTVSSVKDDCAADVLFVGVRGSGETVEGAGLGETNLAVELRLSTLLRPINVVGEPVDYPAVNIVTRVLASGAQGLEVYRQSEAAGEQQLVNTLYLWHHRCPNYLFVLSGFSQGAQVVGNVMSTLAHDPSDAAVFARVAGATLFGDPLYNPADPVAVSPPNRTQVGVMASYFGSSGPRPIYRPPLDAMIRSWCAAGDPICSSYPPLAALQLAACLPDSPCPHLHYANGATDDAARWLAERVKSRMVAGVSTTPPVAPTTPGAAHTTPPPGKPGSGHDCVAFLADITAPDGTAVTAGQTFTKTWRLRNCGTTDWSGLTAVRTGGDYGPATFTVPVTPSGATANVSAMFTAPATPGRYQATYRLQAADGHFADHEFWVEVQVATPTTVAPQPPAPTDGQIPPVTDPGQTPLPSGAQRLGGIDLDHYCSSWNRRSMLRFPNTWGWRCSTSTVPASGNRVGDQYINTVDACTQQYGPNAVSHYADYSDPASWSCWTK